MTEHQKNDNRVDVLEQLQRIMSVVSWSDDEVAEMANDPDHLNGFDIMAYVEGSLSANKRTDLERHMIGCSFCFHQVRETRRALKPSHPSVSTIAKLASVGTPNILAAIASYQSKDSRIEDEIETAQETVLRFWHDQGVDSATAKSAEQSEVFDDKFILDIGGAAIHLEGTNCDQCADVFHAAFDQSSRLGRIVETARTVEQSIASFLQGKLESWRASAYRLEPAPAGFATESNADATDRPPLIEEEHLIVDVLLKNDGSRWLTIDGDSNQTGRLLLLHDDEKWMRFLIPHEVSGGSLARLKLESDLKGRIVKQEIAISDLDSPEYIEQLKHSFEAARRDDHDAIPAWETWATRLLEKHSSDMSDRLENELRCIKEASKSSTESEDNSA